MRKQIPRPRLQGAPWEQCRTLLASSHTTTRAVHTCCSSSSGHFPWAGNLRMLFFQRGESSAGRWGGSSGAAWDTAHPAPCFTPRHKASTAVPPWPINQEPNYSNLWLVFQGQRGAAVAQHCAKSSSNTRHKPLQFGMISQHPCEPGFPQPGDLLRYQPAEWGDKSLHQQNLRTCSVSKS